MDDNQQQPNEPAVHTYQDDLDNNKPDEVANEESEKSNPYPPVPGAPEPMNHVGDDNPADNSSPANDDMREDIEDKDQDQNDQN